jgi:hypothetical protein
MDLLALDPQFPIEEVKLFEAGVGMRRVGSVRCQPGPRSMLLKAGIVRILVLANLR